MKQICAKKLLNSLIYVLAQIVKYSWHEQAWMSVWWNTISETKESLNSILRDVILL